MKRIILHLIFMSGMVFPALAQNAYEYDMRPDVPVAKEVVLEGIQTTEELKLMIKVEWKTSDDCLHLTFDRKTINENDVYLLFFPLLSEKKVLNEVVDCKLQKKSLYSKTLSVTTSKMGYFLTSENLIIADRFNCYRSLANNNEEEFAFEMKNIDEDFSIELTDLYVAKTQKKPWYTFSKRDKKLLFKIKPVTLQIIPEKKQSKTNLCGMEGIVVPYIQAQYTFLKTDIEALMEAKQKQNCTVFGLFMDKIRRTFIELNDKCERYADCEQIAEALQIYNNDVKNIMKEECKAPVQQATCNMSENELMSINNMLKNLQMKINVKNKEGSSTAAEYKDFQSIKNAVTPKLTPECRRVHKSLIDAYTSYCTVIQGLF